MAPLTDFDRATTLSLTKLRLISLASTLMRFSSPRVRVRVRVGVRVMVRVGGHGGRARVGG